MWCAMLQGQASVPAAQAQVIYSSMPLWSAGIASVVLTNEMLGPLGWVGGLAIIAAGLIAAQHPRA